MHKVVIGLGFGDESKGSVVDYLALQHSLSSNQPLIVIRYSGGQQAGHTVYLKDKNHIFSNFGSATLRNVPTYWSKYCSFDPVGFLNEYNALKELGIIPKIYVDQNCPITTPYEKASNFDVDNLGHGTCGVGVGPTFEREENFYHLQILDLKFPNIFRAKYDLIKNRYHSRRQKIKESAMDNFEAAVVDVMDKIIVVDSTFLQKLKDKYVIIFEGSQGLMLDQTFGFFPHVTRSNVGLLNIQKMMGQMPLDIYLVTRSYSTRHGNGPMLFEDDLIINNPYEINQHDLVRGNFRKSYLNLDLLNYALMTEKRFINHKKNLVITHLDAFEDWYHLRDGNKLLEFGSSKDFVLHLKNNLYFDFVNIYINDSPYTSTIRVQPYEK